MFKLLGSHCWHFDETCQRVQIWSFTIIKIPILEGKIWKKVFIRKKFLYSLLYLTHFQIRLRNKHSATTDNSNCDPHLSNSTKNRSGFDVLLIEVKVVGIKKAKNILLDNSIQVYDWNQYLHRYMHILRVFEKNAIWISWWFSHIEISNFRLIK